MSALGFGIATAAAIAIGAVGFTLQFGITNVLNLSYGAVMTVAAFMTFELTGVGSNPWLAMAIASLGAGALSVLLNRGIFMKFAQRGASLFTMAIVTLAVQMIINYGLQAFFGTGFMSIGGIVPGSAHHFLGMSFTSLQLIVIVIAVCSVTGVFLLLQRTGLGRAMRATATNAALARNSGIRTKRVVDATWAISGILCGLCGVALAISIQSFDFTFGQTFLVTIIAAAVLGGVGQAYGAVIGALIVSVAGSVVAAYTSALFTEITAFAILILVILLRPQGIIAEIALQKEVVA